MSSFEGSLEVFEDFLPVLKDLLTNAMGGSLFPSEE